MVEAFIDVAVREELLHAVICLIVLDVGPVCHIELLVDCESPLVGIIADTAAISLSTHAFAIQSVALRLFIEQSLGLDSLLVGLRAYHTLTVA